MWSVSMMFLKACGLSCVWCGFGNHMTSAFFHCIGSCEVSDILVNNGRNCLASGRCCFSRHGGIFEIVVAVECLAERKRVSMVCRSGNSSSGMLLVD